MLNRSLLFLRTITITTIVIFGLPLFLIAQSKLDSRVKGEEIRSSVSYCNLELAQGWKLGNLTFNSLYSFTINANGEVDRIMKIRDDFIGEKSVKACISRWQIIGVSNKSPFFVYFKWKHGKGWVEQRILGNGFTQVMTMEDVGYEKHGNSKPD